MSIAPVQIVEATAGPMLESARGLIVEYGRSIAHIAACSLEHQRFDDEVAGLPGPYAPPRGQIWVATVDGEAVGCVALKPLPALGPNVCELKRMYVRPAGRGRGIGRMLAKHFLEQAPCLGYRLVKLDSARNPSFAAALVLYESLGFTPCANYNADPDPTSVWYEKHL